MERKGTCSPYMPGISWYGLMLIKISETFVYILFWVNRVSICAAKSSAETFSEERERETHIVQDELPGHPGHIHHISVLRWRPLSRPLSRHASPPPLDPVPRGGRRRHPVPATNKDNKTDPILLIFPPEVACVVVMVR